MKPVLFCCLVLWLVGCAQQKPLETIHLSSIIRAESKPTLLFAPNTQTPTTTKKLNTAQLINRYQAILELEDDAEKRARIQKRITDLHMLQTERAHFSGDETDTQDVTGNYQAIIENYQALLAANPDDPASEAILYQLAKAYDYQADSENQKAALRQLTAQFPTSSHAIESHYRLGDIYYSQADYAQAQHHYQAVIEAGQSDYLLNARYMRGWCLFKRSLYPQALASFSEVLDESLADKRLEDIDANQHTLVHDTLHIMSVSFSYLENGQSIAELYQELGARPYEPILYQQLAHLLLERGIHHAAIDTYQTFLTHYPLHEWAPKFHIEIIESYKKGRYFDDVRPAQDVFIQTYASTGLYWHNASTETQGLIIEQMQPLLTDMTRYHHARGQALLKNKRHDEAMASLQLAGEYYRQALEFYPEHENSAEFAFLLAEALTLQKRILPASYWYEQAAYAYPAHPYSEQAAYSTVLSFQELSEAVTAPSAVKTLLQQARIASQKRYIEHFPESDKIAQLWLNTAHSEFELQQYPDALASSQQGLLLAERLNPEQRNALQLIAANSYYAQQDFAQAERAYLQLRPNLRKKDEQNLITERIAECIYRQGEAAVANGDLDTAISHFQRVRQIVPESQFVVNADYDAATYLLLRERWTDAISALKAFQIAHPKHAFNADIPNKLIAVYEGMEDWHSAAFELRKLSKNTADKELQRQTLYLAAQYEEKAGNTDLALADYRDYAKRYPEPFDLLLETRFKISEIYHQKNDQAMRELWLKTLIDAEKQQSTERSRYLAAWAHSIFAEQQLTHYQAQRLTLPLNKSLAQKQQAFSQVMTRMQTIAQYEVAEFTTYAVHQQAEMYREFAKALMTSDKPKGLDELELEQYDYLLEEQAYPFEEQAIALYEHNASYSWQGVYDKWVKASFEALKTLMPGRYNKNEEVMLSENNIL